MAKREPYHVITEGEWVAVPKRNYHLACCDCALVHVINHRIGKDGGLEVQYRVNRRSTAAMRRPFKFSKDE